MSRPDIHDIRNRHLSEVIKEAVYHCVNWHSRPHDEQVAIVQQALEGHLASMGLCLLTEDD